MTKTPYRYVSQIGPNRYRAMVNHAHVGVYDSAETAAQAADDYIVCGYETRGLEYCGRLQLNFPDACDPLGKRMLDQARERGDFHVLFGQYLTPSDVDGSSVHTSLSSGVAGKVKPTGNKWLDIYNNLVHYDPKFLEFYPTFDVFDDMCSFTGYSPNLIRHKVQGQYKRAGYDAPILTF